MKLIYVVRRDEAWHKYKKIGERWLFAKQIQNAWDNTFNIKYTDFRCMLDDVRKINQSHLHFDEYINSYELKMPLRGMFVPTDEDDWFHPDVTKVLKEKITPETFDYRWNLTRFTKNIIEPFQEPIKNPYILWHSNNYAVINPEEIDYITNHSAQDEKEDKKELFFPDHLSVYNRNLGSLSFHMWHNNELNITITTPKLLIEHYERFREPIHRTGEIPAYFEQFIDLMRDIYKNKLKPRKMFI